MYAARLYFRFMRTFVWQFLFCLTLVSFLCRSAIPAGYMPGLSGERGDSFAITVCAGGYPAVVQVDLHDSSVDSSPDGLGAGQECPFGLAAAQELLPNGAALELAGSVHARPVVLPQAGFRRAASVTGPPVGSRAPPVPFV